MATNTVQDHKSEDDHLVKQDHHDEQHDVAEEEEEEEEEALSLCDLPLTLINDKGQDKPRKQDTEFGETEETEQDEFDFNSWGGLLFSQEPNHQMCVADEVFFQGQILPLRHSFSSDPSSSKIKESQIMQENGGNNNKQFNRCESRSESMDNISSSNSNSSSRSCSLRSQNSSSSTSSSRTPKIRNQFHTIPSPKPQLRQTLFSFGNQGRKSSSSAWEFFRLGVAPAPEMLGLQDLKFRNSSSSSSNNSTSVKKMSSSSSTKKFVSRSSGGLLSGCGCSVDSVVAQLDTVMIKSTNTKTESVATSHAMKEKVGVAKLKEQNKKKHNHNRQKHQAKNVMSRRRTFEWLKELHAIRHLEDEQALLSNT